MMIACAVAMRLEDLAGRAGGSSAVELDVLDRVGCVRGTAGLDHELLKRPPVLFAASTRVRTGASLIGSTVPGTSSAVAIARLRVGESLAGLQSAGPLDSNRQVLIAEVEPHVDADRSQSVHHVERVAVETPAALVDPVSEPEA